MTDQFMQRQMAVEELAKASTPDKVKEVLADRGDVLFDLAAHMSEMAVLKDRLEDAAADMENTASEARRVLREMENKLRRTK